nr:hypothetical protein [Microcoleus sp. PH2017_13_LAR_U_A]
MPGLTGVTASDGGTYNAVTGIVSFPAVAIASGVTVNRTIGFVPPVALPSIKNTATSSSATPDPTPGNNNGTNPESSVSTTLGAIADVVTTKSGPTATTAGRTISYTIATANSRLDGSHGIRRRYVQPSYRDCYIPWDCTRQWRISQSDDRLCRPRYPDLNQKYGSELLDDSRPDRHQQRRQHHQSRRHSHQLICCHQHHAQR